MTKTASPVDIATLNDLPEAEFVDLLGGVFEHSPWVAEKAAAARPFADTDELHAAMMGVLLALPPGDQIDFLRKHPSLSARAMRPRDIAAESLVEQRSAGLDAVDAITAEKLDGLNTEYQRRFGFPFIIAARGNSVSAILAAIETRISRPADVEVDEALAQIGRITRLRLDALLTG